MTANEPGFDPALGSLPEPNPPWPSGSPPPPHTPPPPQATTADRPTAPSGCAVCGAQPSENFSFEQITGFVVRWRRDRFDGRWCGTCAQAVGRKAQNRTLLTGWFGVVAFVVNVVTVGTNASGLRRAAQLPSGSATQTLDPGRPMHARPGALGALAIGGLAAFAVYSLATDNTVRFDDLEVSECLADPGSGEISSVEAIPCSEPHFFEVYAVGDLDDRPYLGDSAVAAIVDVRCALAFEEYVGRAVGESTYYYSSINPTAQSWTEPGGRSYFCVLGSFAGESVGSARDSGD